MLYFALGRERVSMSTDCFFYSVREYDPAALQMVLEEGLAGLGLAAGVFKPGDRVLLKPNLLAGSPPERAVTTHPRLVEAVAMVLLDRGCRVWAGDSPALDNTSSALAKSGYRDWMSRLGVKTASFDRGADVPSRHRRWFTRLHLDAGLTEFDHLVNLPKLKTHSMMTLTLGVKNLFGCVSGKRKVAYHFSAGESREYFARLLLEIWETVSPVLTILDGITGMEGNGPRNGRPVHLGILGMARNTLALDAVTAALLNVPPSRHPVVAEGLQAGITGANADEMTTAGTPLAMLRSDKFLLPAAAGLKFYLPPFLAGMFKEGVTEQPVIRSERCIKCMECAAICPAGAIGEDRDDGPRILTKRCIQCYCCQEICPQDAVAIHSGWMLRLGRAIRRGSSGHDI